MPAVARPRRPFGEPFVARRTAGRPVPLRQADPGRTVGRAPEERSGSRDDHDGPALVIFHGTQDHHDPGHFSHPVKPSSRPRRAGISWAETSPRLNITA